MTLKFGIVFVDFFVFLGQRADGFEIHKFCRHGDKLARIIEVKLFLWRVLDDLDVLARDFRDEDVFDADFSVLYELIKHRYRPVKIAQMVDNLGLCNDKIAVDRLGINDFRTQFFLSVIAALSKICIACRLLGTLRYNRIKRIFFCNVNVRFVLNDFILHTKTYYKRIDINTRTQKSQ